MGTVQRKLTLSGEDGELASLKTRCNEFIFGRLDSANSDKLVYQNEKYLAVFDSITDYHHAEEGPASITGGHTLYARP